MKKGVVKFFNEEKGFGFIKPDDATKDVFVHKTGLTTNVQENDRVVFDLEQSARGLSAVNVKLA